jgi:dolichol-phosphate mannosyltransferase
MKTLEFVIPIFNEEDCVTQLIDRLNAVRQKLAGEYSVSFLFVNDGSRDKTLSLLRAASQEQSHLKFINLSRNFGHQVALTAGLDATEADFVCIIDGDLQDPPELVEPMLDVLSGGYDIVYGQRRARKGETWFKRATASLFYRFFNRFCRVDIPRDTGDFRLITRRVVYAFRNLRERHRFIRGMIPWLGFRSTGFLYERDGRFAGTTKYPLKKMVRFALDAVLSFSQTPLRMATYSGLGLVLLSVLGAAFMLYVKLFTDHSVPGITVVILSILFIGGFQIVMLGLIGEYIGRIFEEVKDRPL